MADEPLVPPEALTEIAKASRVLFIVHFGDDISGTLEDLAQLDCFKIILINTGLLRYFVNLKKQLHMFDLVFSFDGPGIEDITYGNLPMLEAGDSEIIIPSLYESVCKLLDRILPVVRNKDSFYLSTIHEEAIVQVAILREKYGLKLGLTAELARLFVSKNKMKQFFVENGITTADYIEADTAELLKYDPQALDTFMRERLPPFPVFVKPIAGAGSFETSVLNNENDFKEWLMKSGKYRYKKFLIEEKLEGPQTGYQAYSTKDGIITNVCDAMLGFGWGDLLDGKAVHNRNLRSDDPLFKQIEACGRSVLLKAGVAQHYGVYFMEMMYKRNGQLAILEMAARCYAGVGGNAKSYYVHGFDTESYALAAPFMQDIELTKKERIRFKYFSNIVLPSRHTGKVKRYNDIDPKYIKNGAAIVINETTYNVGEKVHNRLTNIDEVAQIIHIGGDDEEAVTESGENLRRFHDPVEVE